jgi:hypothetical protein
VTCLPLLCKVKQDTAEESEKLYKQLRKHGISEKVAQKIIKFYEKG